MNYSHVLHSELNYKNLLQNLNVMKCVNLDRYFRNNTYSNSQLKARCHNLICNFMIKKRLWDNL